MIYSCVGSRKNFGCLGFILKYRGDLDPLNRSKVALSTRYWLGAGLTFLLTD